MSKFTGYNFLIKGGYHEKGVELNTPEACYQFVFSNMSLYPEIRVCDNNDYIVIHALDGKIVFPFEISNELITFSQELNDFPQTYLKQKLQE